MAGQWRTFVACVTVLMTLANLEAGRGVSAAAPASGLARAHLQPSSAMSPCQPSQLRATAFLQGATSGYMMKSGRYQYTCVGIRLTARQTDGTTSYYGGWYMTRATSVADTALYLPGSHITINGALWTVDRPTCRGGVP